VLAAAIPILTILTCATETNAQSRTLSNSRSPPPRGRLCLFSVSLLGTGGDFLCRQPAQRVVTDTACKAYVPIRYSRKDTPETVRQVREHNAAFDALCKPK
jgi:hypothetical protein